MQQPAPSLSWAECGPGLGCSVNGPDVLLQVVLQGTGNDCTAKISQSCSLTTAGENQAQVNTQWQTKHVLSCSISSNDNSNTAFSCFLCCVSGACWPSLWWSACPELILGLWGLDLQVLWGHPGGPIPQGHPSWSQGQLDLQTCAQAPWDAWPNLSRAQFPRPGQRSFVQQNYWRFASCQLEEKQYSQLVAETLIFLFQYKIKCLFTLALYVCLDSVKCMCACEPDNFLTTQCIYIYGSDTTIGDKS